MKTIHFVSLLLLRLSQFLRHVCTMGFMPTKKINLKKMNLECEYENQITGSMLLAHC